MSEVLSSMDVVCPEGGPAKSSNLIRISVIIPLKNEESTIENLLRDLLAQTYMPSEIVITDAGSQDRSREIIRDFQTFSQVPIVLIESPQALPGRARNLAIARARFEWIATIDGGTRPRPDWLAELVAASQREPEARIIYGIAEPVTDTYFTQSAAVAYVPQGGRIQPSIASALLHQSAWAAVGGFPEDLRSGEDLLFFRAVKAVQVPRANCDTAVVAWQLSPNTISTFRRFTAYSRSNLKAGLGREWQLNVVRLYVLFIVLVLAALWFWPLLAAPPLLYLLRVETRISQWYQIKEPTHITRALLSPRRVSTVMWIQLIVDLATLVGLAQWVGCDHAVKTREVAQRNTDLAKNSTN